MFLQLKVLYLFPSNPHAHPLYISVVVFSCSTVVAMSVHVFGDPPQRFWGWNCCKRFTLLIGLGFTGRCKFWKPKLHLISDEPQAPPNPTHPPKREKPQKGKSSIMSSGGCLQKRGANVLNLRCTTMERGIEPSSNSRQREHKIRHRGSTSPQYCLSKARGQATHGPDQAAQKAWSLVWSSPDRVPFWRPPNSRQQEVQNSG